METGTPSSVQIPRLRTGRVIKDPVHGNIPVTDAEYDLIQLPMFMRLHRVSQNSMAYLTYPGAQASRFEHVVGAMFVGSKIADQVLGEMDDSDFKVLFPDLDASACPDLAKAVRLACLFHDAGHGPFSHASEKIMKDAASGAELAEAESLLGPKPAIHEYFSHKLFHAEQVRAVLESEDPLLAEAAAALLVDRPDGGFARKNGPGAACFRKMVSGQLDADRADYLARDSMMAGVAYGRIDFDRILDNMAVVPDRQGAYELAVHYRAMGAVEDMLDARFKMYKWFYRHHAVAASSHLLEESLAQAVSDGTLCGDLFRWRSFADGLGDDSVLNAVMEEWRKSGKYGIYRGLWDRRHFPVSVLKHPSDYSEFAKQAMAATGRSMADGDILKAIKRLAPSYRAGDGQPADPLNRAHMMIRFSDGAPYRPLKAPSDSIWLRTDDGRLHELTTKSPYTKRLNEAWADDPSVYISCVVPGLPRSEITPAMKEELKGRAIRAMFS